MKRFVAIAALTCAATFVSISVSQPASSAPAFDGRRIFRFDTFGDEQLWTDTLQIQRAIASLSPATALRVGLKVDLDALPKSVVKALRTGRVDLDDPAVTIQLLALNAVVGVIGRGGATGNLESIGITCALCHSTVDNSLADGCGFRKF
jgi:hypothetical protein